jgi:hypothetical protein
MMTAAEVDVEFARKEARSEYIARSLLLTSHRPKHAFLILGLCSCLLIDRVCGHMVRYSTEDAEVLEAKTWKYLDLCDLWKL